MTLNSLFLGDNSVVDLATKDTVDVIKLKLASRYSRSRLDPKMRFPEEHEDFGSDYVYYVKKDGLEIHFAKDLNWRVRHSFQLTYPWFTGQIIDHGDLRFIKGKIGLPEWTYYFTLLWFSFFAFIYIGWTIKGESEFRQGDVALYFILFGLLTYLIGLIRTRKKVVELREEIDRVFSNAR
jgi:hypothetical protein